MTDVPKRHRQKELLAYAQGFLGPQEQAELEEHLKHCPDCQKTLEDVRRFLPALQQALTPPEMSTEEMLVKVRERMRSQPPKPAPFFTRMRVGLMAGAALAAAVLIFGQPLLHQTDAAGIAKRNQADAGSEKPEKALAAPRRPTRILDGGPDAGLLLFWDDLH